MSKSPIWSLTFVPCFILVPNVDYGSQSISFFFQNDSSVHLFVKTLLLRGILGGSDFIYLC